MTRTLFALSQHATACDNKLQVAVRNDMRLFLRTTKYYSVLQSSTPDQYSVLQSINPVLLCTTLYYKVLLQYYSVLQVLLQYCSVLKSTTPVLLCTTKYYSSTTRYYKVLLQYYSVLQSTTPVLPSATPVLLSTTKYYSSTTLYYKVLLRTTK